MATVVAYTVGKFSTKSYAEALKEQETTGLGITRHYIPIPETTPLDEKSEELRQKRVAQWYASHGKKEVQA